MSRGAPIYEQLVWAGVPIDHHESDLYAKVTPASTAIVNATAGIKVTTFVSQIDGERWYDIPFAYLPWWEARQGR